MKNELKSLNKIWRIKPASEVRDVVKMIITSQNNQLTIVESTKINCDRQMKDWDKTFAEKLILGFTPIMCKTRITKRSGQIVETFIIYLLDSMTVKG